MRVQKLATGAVLGGQFILLMMASGLMGCSTVYPLQSVAKRTEDPRSLQSDVRVDTASRDIGGVRSLAWAAYSVTFECESQCPYTADERKLIATQLAESSFTALDREMRKALGGPTSRSLQEVDATVKSSAFGAATIPTDSYRSRVGSWMGKLGLSRTPEITAAARGLKAVDPSEIGWSGEESLLTLGRRLGVDGVLVGHMRVVVETSDEGPKLNVQGPKLWFFSSHKPKAVAIAELRPSWRVETANQLTGFDEVASGFSARIAQEISD